MNSIKIPQLQKTVTPTINVKPQTEFLYSFKLVLSPYKTLVLNLLASQQSFVCAECSLSPHVFWELSADKKKKKKTFVNITARTLHKV